jgi:hypothetical protein
MRPSTLARFGLLLAVIPASSFLAACGGGGSSKKVDVDDWVSDLCDAAADFSKASDKAGETFGDADLDDTKAAKAAFKKSLDAQKKAQKEFRSDFDKIGQPDIENGDKVVKAFQDEFKAHDKQTEDVGKAVADIDDDDNFTDAFFDIADKFDVPDFREKLTAIADDSDSSDVQDLIDQIDADSDCSNTIFQSGSGADNSSSNPTPSANKTSVAAKSPTAKANGTAPAAKTTNEKWVVGICKSFDTWVNDIGDANDALQDKLDSTKDAAGLKKVLLDFLKTGQADTKTLQKDVSALKAPDVKDGAAIQKVFVDTTGDLVGVFDDLISQANKVRTDSLSQTTADVDRIADSVADAFDEASAGFDKLDNYDAPELEDLFDQRPECSGIG